jgi:hypothetical protein
VPAAVVLQLRVHGGVAAGMIEVQVGVDHPPDVAGQ